MYLESSNHTSRFYCFCVSRGCEFISKSVHSVVGTMPWSFRRICSCAARDLVSVLFMMFSHMRRTGKGQPLNRSLDAEPQLQGVAMQVAL